MKTTHVLQQFEKLTMMTLMRTLLLCLSTLVLCNQGCSSSGYTDSSDDEFSDGEDVEDLFKRNAPYVVIEVSEERMTQPVTAPTEKLLEAFREKCRREKEKAKTLELILKMDNPLGGITGVSQTECIMYTRPFISIIGEVFGSKPRAIQTTASLEISATNATNEELLYTEWINIVRALTPFAQLNLTVRVGYESPLEFSDYFRQVAEITPNLHLIMIGVGIQRVYNKDMLHTLELYNYLQSKSMTAPRGESSTAALSFDTIKPSPLDIYRQFFAFYQGPHFQSIQFLAFDHEGLDPMITMLVLNGSAPRYSIHYNHLTLDYIDRIYQPIRQYYSSKQHPAPEDLITIIVNLSKRLVENPETGERTYEDLQFTIFQNSNVCPEALQSLKSSVFAPDQQEQEETLQNFAHYSSQCEEEQAINIMGAFDERIRDFCLRILKVEPGDVEQAKKKLTTLLSYRTLSMDSETGFQERQEDTIEILRGHQ